MEHEPIFNRIMQHKQVSLELKAATENYKPANKELIRNILETTRMQTDGRSEAHFTQQSQIPTLSKSTHSFADLVLGSTQQDQSSTYDRHGGISQIGQQYQKNRIQNGQVNNPYSYLSTAEQVTRMKHDNDQLQTRIKQLQNELNELDELHEMEMQQEWKDGLPYYILSLPKIGAFCTRLTISQKDYEKIDYKDYSICLDLQKLKLIPAALAKNTNESPKMKGSTRFKKRVIILNLENLKSVEYPSFPSAKQEVDQKPYSSSLSHFDKIKEEDEQFIIIYHFQDESEMSRQTLYLKFSNEEEMNEWDMGIYMNYKILENLKADDANRSLRPKEESSLASFKDRKLIASEQMSPRFKVKPTQKRDLNLVNSLVQGQSEQSYVGQDVSIVGPTEQEQENQIMANQQAEQERERQRQIQIQEEQLQRKREEELEQKRKKEEEERQEEEKKRIAEERARKDEEARLKREEEEQRRRIEQENLKKARIVERQIAISKAKSALKRGYLLTKYAKGALNPHQKRVMINSDEDKLCWRDTDSLNFKHVNIKDIQEVRKGQIGPGIEKHLSGDKLKRKHCFVVIEIGSDDRKFLEFGAKDPETMNSFCNDLMLCLSEKSTQHNSGDIKF